jgi:hypothetical protein
LRKTSAAARARRRREILAENSWFDKAFDGFFNLTGKIELRGLALILALFFALIVISSKM